MKQQSLIQCPHCGHGDLVGYGGRFLLRCNNFSECGRYVIEE